MVWMISCVIRVFFRPYFWKNITNKVGNSEMLFEGNKPYHNLSVRFFVFNFVGKSKKSSNGMKNFPRFFLCFVSLNKGWGTSEFSWFSEKEFWYRSPFKFFFIESESMLVYRTSGGIKWRRSLIVIFGFGLIMP